MSAILTTLKTHASKEFIYLVKVMASCKTAEQYNATIDWAHKISERFDTTEKAVYIGVLIAKQLEFGYGYGN